MVRANESGQGAVKLRGFASMDQEKQREIARKGGKAAHEKGTAHEFTSDEARAAGKKGGEAVSRNRAHMSAIGQRGGQQSAGGRRSRQQHVSANQEEETMLQNPISIQGQSVAHS
jgi:general stress protein YciG